MRITQQRKAIYAALAESGRPLSVSEIHTLASGEVRGLGIATVYRNLKALQGEAKVVQVDLPGQTPRWEVGPSAHPNHFLCRTCDKLFEINACPEDIKRLLPEGYILESHDILLQGQCDACAGGVGRD